MRFRHRQLCRVAPVLALLGCGAPPPTAAPVGAPSPAPPPTSERASDVEAPEGVVALFVEAQRTYLERGDTKPFAALILPDAEIRASRTRAPAWFDFVFGKDQFGPWRY